MGYYEMVMNLSKNVFTLFLVLCLCSAIIIKNNRVLVNASPSTLMVPDDYKTIQEAINNAGSGDTIFVRKGIYTENIVINKSITLIGEDRESTIIDGRATGNVISIKASNVTIKGFTIRNSDPFVGYGIFIERFGNIVISNNSINNNNIGIQISFSSRNQIYENIISANYVGIQLFYSSGNAVYRNVISSNTDGIDVYYYSVGNTFYENTINNNNWGVYLSFYSNNNVFYHNNFVGNIYNVYAEQTANIWCYNGEGNYWDDYEGEDLDKDGIGNTPYVITGKNTDYYPLMGRYYTFAVHFKEEDYRIAMASNSTISNFTFKVVAESRTRIILFNASSTNGSAGFSRVVIPKALMENIHMVLVSEEEVNATLLNVADVENTYLYIEYPGNCSIKIVYLELLDLYYQLLADYSKLLDELHGLNATNNALVKEFNLLNETLHNLQKNYDELQNYLDNLNSMLTTLNKTLHNFLKSYSDFQKEFSDINMSYQNEAQNFKSLTYVFAAIIAVFIMITIYLSKIAHEKQRRVIES
jgi:parallel beta-helix repeat protein